MYDYRGEIAKKKQELAELEAAQKEMDQHPDKMLATLLHDTFCHSNHTDGCGWHYDKDFTSGTKLQYLQKAREIMRLADRNDITFANLVLVISLLKGI